MVGTGIRAEFPGLFSISSGFKALSSVTAGLKAGFWDKSHEVENLFRDQPPLLGSGRLFLCQNDFGKFLR